MDYIFYIYATYARILNKSALSVATLHEIAAGTIKKLYNIFSVPSLSAET